MPSSLSTQCRCGTGSGGGAGRASVGGGGADGILEEGAEGPSAGETDEEEEFINSNSITHGGTL